MTDHFLKPTFVERLLNKAVGAVAGMGWGPSYLHLVEVRGRKTGKTYSTPVNTISIEGRLYLVGGRGHTAWSRNARATGEVTLRRGPSSWRYRAVPLDDEQKPPVLKAYLETYRGTVQRFFSVPAGSPVEAFQSIAERHPVFELILR